jgi:amino acid transporter
MVVGSMVGAGVFSLPRRFAQETGVAGALIAWAVAGTGMLMLAFVFQRLAIRRPDLDAGVYAYAKAGFGEYLGFFSAFGHWASACVGNVTYWVLIMSTIGAIAPALGDGDTVLAVVLASVGLWSLFLLIRRGRRPLHDLPHRAGPRGLLTVPRSAQLRPSALSAAATDGFHQVVTGSHTSTASPAPSSAAVKERP